MNPELIARLMAPPSKKSGGYVIVLENGRAVRKPIDKEVARIARSFQGKQGTVRRSSKGRTYIAPNGSRRFTLPYDLARPEVIAYNLGK
jgi:hypothetical protein